MSRGGLCPFVKLLFYSGFGYVLEVSGLPATNKTPTKARGGYGTLKKQAFYRNFSRKRCPRGPNGSPRHLQGGVDEVTFSWFLPSRPQVVPKMAPGEPQGCPEPPQVPTFGDMFSISDGICTDFLYFLGGPGNAQATKVNIKIWAAFPPAFEECKGGRTHLALPEYCRKPQLGHGGGNAEGKWICIFVDV